MIRPVRAIKEELRILGLDLCNEELTVGVVCRGGLYLDGLISFRPDPKNLFSGPARRIVDSAFFPELRAVMLHQVGNGGGMRSMERITNLPTMTMSEDEPLHERGYEVFHSRRGRLLVKTRLEHAIVRKILETSWTYGRLPEPLRVAHQLAQLDLPEISG
jgi:endonuclease V-like protein UPF0215 family